MKFSIYHFILKYFDRIKYHTAYQNFKSDEKKEQHSQRRKILSFTDRENVLSVKVQIVYKTPLNA